MRVGIFVSVVYGDVESSSAAEIFELRREYESVNQLYFEKIESASTNFFLSLLISFKRDLKQLNFRNIGRIYSCIKIMHTNLTYFLVI